MGADLESTAPLPVVAASPEPGKSRPRGPARTIVFAIIGALLWSAAFWSGWTFQRTWSASNGEPTSVIVATWMRDNHMGPVVAQLENIYYRYVDKPKVGGEPTISADVSKEDAADTDTSDIGPALPSASSSASAAPSAPAERAHLQPPPPLVSPVTNPEPLEGQWQPVASKVDGIPAVYVTRVRADVEHSSYYASVMWIDTMLTKALFVPGYEEPAGGPNPYNGALPQSLWPFVLANFNGAFRLEDTMGGYEYDGDVVAPLVKGKGTTVFYRDGSIKVGKWGRDFASVTDDMIAVRQNLNLIVDKGESKVSSASDNVVWGATTDKESLAWRAAIGQRDDGSIVYIGSPYLSAKGLADTLVSAGVREAMVLDMNNWWTAGFYFRHAKDGSPKCRKLEPTISEGCDRFLKPYKRDSFQFLGNPSSGALDSVWPVPQTSSVTP
jgi:hypothetical protein